MLAGPLPALVDHRKLAGQEGRVSGELPVVHFTRFVEMLADRQGEVHLELQFDQDENRRTRVRGAVSVTANLICQSCLAPYAQQLSTELDYVIVTGEADRASLDEEQDSIVHADPKIGFDVLVEDDLILSVPMIPRHSENCPDSDYAVPAENQVPAEQPDETYRPFAGLAEAIKKQNEVES